MTTKHAYLIMADYGLEQLCRLLKSLDHPQNDFYVHIDAKVEISSDQIQALERSVQVGQLYFLERHSLSWGGTSIMMCEFQLFAAARMHGAYHYYHLLSGRDFPLQSQDFLHQYLADKQVQYVQYLPINEEVLNRARLWHFNPNLVAYRSQSKFRSVVLRTYRKLEREIQKYLGVNRLDKLGIQLGFGSQWVSVTDELVGRLLVKQKELEKKFQNVLICDELFLQSFLNEESDLRKQVAPEGNRRFLEIPIGQSSPKVLGMTDKELLFEQAQAGIFFARKFDQDIDGQIITQLEEKVRR